MKPERMRKKLLDVIHASLRGLAELGYISEDKVKSTMRDIEDEVYR